VFRVEQLDVELDARQDREGFQESDSWQRVVRFQADPKS
jgi:hypothetical protein